MFCCWCSSISYLSSLLDKEDRSVRIAAGEALALIFEIGVIDKFSAKSDSASDTTQEGSKPLESYIFLQGLKGKVINQCKNLSTEAGGKGSAKKDLNSQRNLFRDILDFFEVVCFYHYCYYYLKMNNVLLMKLKLLYWSYLVILVWLLPGYFNEDWWWFPAGIIMVWNDAGFSHVLSLYILAEISFYFSILTSRFLQLNFIKHFLGGGFIKHMQVGFLWLFSLACIWLLYNLEVMFTPSFPLLPWQTGKWVPTWSLWFLTEEKVS